VTAQTSHQTRTDHRAVVTAASELLHGIAVKYYLGCKAYHLCVQAGSPDRALWHVRLKTLTQIGNQLADALGQPWPNWPVLFHTAHRYRRLDHNPFIITPPEPTAPARLRVVR
jgi:hypothetical protein